MSDVLRDIVANLRTWWTSHDIHVPMTTRRAVVLGVAAGLFAYWLMKKRYKLPPGPEPWPLIGNLGQLKGDSIYEVYQKLHDTYGPAFTLHMGPQKIVVLNTIDVVLEALVKRGSDFAGRPDSYTVGIITNGKQDISQADYGPGWKLRRKIGVKAIRRYMSGSNLDEKMQDSVKRALAAMEKETEAFDPHRYLFLLTVNILCGICFGKCYNMDDAEFNSLNQLFDTFMKSLAQGFFLEDLIPPLRLCPTQRFREMTQSFRAFSDYIARNVTQHKETYSADNIRDMCDSILFAQSEVQAEDDEEDRAALMGLSDNHVNLTIGNLFGAGTDTTRLTLYWALLYMAAYPDIQARVQEEIDTSVGRQRFPEIRDRDRLPYTEAVLHEAMRLGSVLPIGVPHVTMCDTHIGEYDVPKGTLIIINHWALSRDPEYWKDADVFNPERYLDSSGKLGPKPYSWLPFSAGRRVCLGETVAKPELHILLAMILQHFRIRLPPGQEVRLEHDKSSVVFGKPYRYKVIMKNRL